MKVSPPTLYEHWTHENEAAFESGDLEAACSFGLLLELLWFAMTDRERARTLRMVPEIAAYHPWTH